VVGLLLVDGSSIITASAIPTALIEPMFWRNAVPPQERIGCLLK